MPQPREDLSLSPSTAQVSTVSTVETCNITVCIVQYTAQWVLGHSLSLWLCWIITHSVSSWLASVKLQLQLHRWIPESIVAWRSNQPDL